jgi:serine/threonine protein kinase
VAKVYGERWQVSSPRALGRGGQAEVFRVTDIRGEYAGDYALKRVLNPARHERFRREVEAIRTIQHPNVIKLIDHSALEAGSEQIEKQFLVMPIAEGGDLGEARRVELYKDSIDNVVQVGKQLTSALAAAHAVGVIHRDVKPENILFTGIGHEIWLSDFGICLLRQNTRLSEPGDILGPRSFLAPELEGGDHLAVSPAADVYSLGKVLYYLISGGVTLPREELTEPKFNAVLQSGERHLLLYSLLQRMVCSLGQRIQSMPEVTEKLALIEAWERKAQVLPLSSEARSSILKLSQKAQQHVRNLNEEKTAREQERLRLQDVQNGFRSWLLSELEKVAAYVNDSLGLKCKVYRPKDTDQRVKIRSSSSGGFFTSLDCLGLSLDSTGTSTGDGDLMLVELCIEQKVVISSYVGAPPPKAVEPPKDFRLAMIPTCRGAKYLAIQRKSPAFGFFTRKAMVGQQRGLYLAARSPYAGPMPSVTPDFHSDASQIVQFHVSEWPQVIDRLRPALQEAIDSFISFVEGST